MLDWEHVGFFLLGTVITGIVSSIIFTIQMRILHPKIKEVKLILDSNDKPIL